MTLSARTSPWLPDSLGPVPWAARPALPARAASKSATSHSFRAEVRHCVLVSVVPGEVGGDLGSDFAARARACLAALSARWSATNRQNGWMYARMYATTDRLIVRAKRPRSKSFRLTNVACADTKREAMSASWLTPASQPAAPEPRAKTLSETRRPCLGRGESSRECWLRPLDLAAAGQAWDWCQDCGCATARDSTSWPGSYSYARQRRRRRGNRRAGGPGRPRACTRSVT